MKHLKLTVEDIMQPKILFYDDHCQNACFEICNYLKIDNLPHISGNYFYELIEDKFEKKQLKSKHKTSIYTPIFSEGLLERFKNNKHNVLFVYYEQSIKGVVHISDYNNDIMLQYIQDDILTLERKLRQLILLKGFLNNHMIDYLNQKKNENNLRDKKKYSNKLRIIAKKKEELEAIGHFQLFEFSDILEFAESNFTNSIFKTKDYKFDGNIESGKEILRKLRNLAMHGKNPIEKQSATSIYSFESLKNLSNSLLVLRKEYSRITNTINSHPAYKRIKLLGNKNKLELISKYRSKSLDYFLDL